MAFPIQADSPVGTLIRASTGGTVHTRPAVVALASTTLTDPVAATVVRAGIHGVAFTTDEQSGSNAKCDKHPH
jgi:ABC-type amino acid transport system permease subunit